MGDFSRDTFKLTNVMHQLLTGETVTNPRHYVGVRLQQGVPVLDADWNELEDIITTDERLKLRHFFGNGIPSGNDGFHIGPVTKDNDFAINTGIALVDGIIVVNSYTYLTYQGQATTLGINVDPLSAAPSDDRDDLVYLDVWDEQIGANESINPDDRLVNSVIGIETCRRIERRWVVRVAPAIIDLSGVIGVPGHAYMALAKLSRKAGKGRIAGGDIYDLRRIDLNVAKYLKIPLYVKRGGNFIDSVRFADMFNSLRGILLDRLENERLFIDTTDDLKQTLANFALLHTTQVCSTGAMQARTNNLTNNDALQVMAILVSAQQQMITTLKDHGISGPAKDAFVNDYQSHLDNVDIANQDDNLFGAYQLQQALNAWLSADVGTLPEGNVNIHFLAIDPEEPLIAGKTYVVYIEVTSSVTSGQDSEIFDINASLSSDLWQLTPESHEIILDNAGGANISQTVNFRVTPNATNLACSLTVTATVRRNPAIVSPQLPLEMQIGEEPLAGAVLNYAGPPLNANNQMELSSAALTSGFGTAVGFELHNKTALSHSYTVQWFISLTSGDEAGWVPVTNSEETTILTVPADSVAGKALNIKGPTGGDVVGNKGTLHVSLIKRDDASLPAEEQESIDVDFICI